VHSAGSRWKERDCVCAGASSPPRRASCERRRGGDGQAARRCEQVGGLSITILATSDPSVTSQLAVCDSFADRVCVRETALSGPGFARRSSFRQGLCSAVVIACHGNVDPAVAVTGDGRLQDPCVLGGSSLPPSSLPSPHSSRTPLPTQPHSTSQSESLTLVDRRPSRSRPSARTSVRTHADLPHLRPFRPSSLSSAFSLAALPSQWPPPPTPPPRAASSTPSRTRASLAASPRVAGLRS